MPQLSLPRPTPYWAPGLPPLMLEPPDLDPPGCSALHIYAGLRLHGDPYPAELVMGNR